MSKKLLANVGNTVVDNYRRYYQEYEGTFITATDKSEDDTLDTSRYIEVAEIFGNTVQDENNLEDIQSVGELYVDDEGQPILDELGREQYKIEIESCNTINLIDRNDYTMIAKEMIFNQIIDSRTNKTFTYKSHSGYNSWVKPFQVDSNGNKIIGGYNLNKQSIVGSDGFNRYTFTVPGNVEYFKLQISHPHPKEQLSIGTSDYPMEDYKPLQTHKTTILLPCQLQKVGDVYDRLYWDSEKGKYVVEKKIQDVNFSNFTLKSTLYNELTTHCRILIELPYLNMNDKLVICNKLKSKVIWHEEIDNTYASNPSLGMLFMISKDKLNEVSSNGCIEWIKSNNIISYYMLQTSQLIETNITEKIQLPCYEEKTHIFVNSTVDATMKVLVPYKEII